MGAGMLWSAAVKLENPEAIAQVHVVALYVALGALVAKELLFRYMLNVAKRVKSTCGWPLLRKCGVPCALRSGLKLRGVGGHRRQSAGLS